MYYLSGDWDDALDVIDKCYNYLTPEQLNQTKLLFLEEKFYALLHAKKVNKVFFFIKLATKERKGNNYVTTHFFLPHYFALLFLTVGVVRSRHLVITHEDT